MLFSDIRGFTSMSGPAETTRPSIPKTSTLRHGQHPCSGTAPSTSTSATRSWACWGALCRWKRRRGTRCSARLRCRRRCASSTIRAQKALEIEIRHRHQHRHGRLRGDQLAAHHAVHGHRRDAVNVASRLCSVAKRARSSSARRRCLGHRQGNTGFRLSPPKGKTRTCGSLHAS